LRTIDAVYDRAAALVHAAYRRRISGPAVLDAAEHFPAAADFAAAWHQLRQEALGLAQSLSAVPRFHELMPQQAPISDNDGRDWRMFVVKAYGVLVRKNALRCPAIASLVASRADVLSASYSFMAPHKHVPEHRGPFRGVVRYYLGLSVPADGTGRPGTVLTIDGIEYRIGDGGWLLWDDTFTHEVRNETPKLRIALLLDVRRRGMPLDLEILTRVLIAGAATAVRMHRFAREPLTPAQRS
jgi:aspartate beta-hydroxylase